MSNNNKIFLKQNVFDAALERIRWLFDEFPNVVVGVSGGKDSDVVLNLSLQVAREKNRLPLKVLFLDQEAEWLGTIEHIREIMAMPGVEPLWMQFHYEINNATSYKENYLQCWDPEQESMWIRPKEPMARKENVFGTKSWYDLFHAMIQKEFGEGVPACYIAGVRAEESPRRAQGLTTQETYKGVTWGKKLWENQYTFYPIYDWSYTDVWKAIFDNQWKYNVVYDKMYQYGVSLNDMRISSLFHETAVRSLFVLQEIEPENYNRITARLGGTNTAGKMSLDFYCPKELPSMFVSWTEYRDYLLENLIKEESNKEIFRKKFLDMDELYLWYMGDKSLRRKQIDAILCNDFLLTKLKNIVVPKHLWPEFKVRRDARKASRASR